jgi:hypothetical protein
MRQIFIAGFFYFFLSPFAKSQTSVYHPFPDSNVVWNVEWANACSVGISNRFWDSYILQGDTVIGLNNYRKVFLAWRIEHWPCWGFNFSGPGYYYGAIRQDTAARTVYYVESNDTTEWLLYDFSLEAGDTLRGYLKSFGCPDDSVVTAVDSVYIDGSYRKRWKFFTWFGPDYIIEGIGYTGGPFTPVCSWFEGGSVLICCTQENIVLFQDSFYTTTPGMCELLNSVPKACDGNEAVLYPNPMHEAAILHTPFQSGTLFLYDCMGRKVMELIIESENSRIERGTLKTGIYYYKATGSDNLYSSGRFIVE